MAKDKVTAPDLVAMKARGEKITFLTAYDYPSARLLDEAGIDVALVGDSLGMVVLGYENTLSVTMDDMIRHTAAVARGAKRALVVGDMPFMSYQVSDEQAVENAGRFMQEAGAQAVKLEGGERVANTVRRIVDAGIPVVGHAGFLPQSVHQFGGVRKKAGKDSEAAAKIKNDAAVLEDAGVSAVVLEAVPADLAGEITENLTVPTIGIGAGPHCDGQVLVMHDIIGMFDRFVPPFVKQYANLWPEILDAYKSYNEDVKEGRFPEK